MALKMKYFVLKPTGADAYATASRLAMLKYAAVIRKFGDHELADGIENWVKEILDEDPLDVARLE